MKKVLNSIAFGICCVLAIFIIIGWGGSIIEYLPPWVFVLFISVILIALFSVLHYKTRKN